MGRLHQRRIPNRVQIRLAVEIEHLDAVTTQVGRATGVHRAVHVAHQVNQHAQFIELLLFREFALLDVLYNAVNSGQNIPFRMARLRLEGLALVDVHVVPRFGMCIGRRMACIIHPVGIIDQRTASEHLGNTLCSFGCQMILGNIGHHIVPLLPPAKDIARGK